MKISVCVPVYGVEKYIERCAVSLFEQTLSNDVEFIFINDCTKDKSIEILQNVLRKYPQRQNQTRIIDHPQNKGLSAARNTAVDAACGTYIYHVDPDDFIEINTLEQLWQTAEEQHADIVVNELIWFWNDKKKTVLPKKFDNRIDFILKVVTRKIQCGVVGNLIKRKLYTDNGISTPDLNMGEDYVTTPRLAYYAEKIVMHPQPMYYYFRGNESAMSRTPSLIRLQEMRRGHNYLVDFFQKQSEQEDFTQCFHEMYIENFIIKKILLHSSKKGL